MEETIGYEALFSPEDWEGLDITQWHESDEEAELIFGDVSPDGTPDEEVTHSVIVYDPPGEHEGTESCFELECERCGHVGAADTRDEAQAIARLHESFVATLVEKWSVDR